jgi:hypothetical protein
MGARICVAGPAVGFVIFIHARGCSRIWSSRDRMGTHHAGCNHAHTRFDLATPSCRLEAILATCLVLWLAQLGHPLCLLRLCALAHQHRAHLHLERHHAFVWRAHRLGMVGRHAQRHARLGLGTWFHRRGAARQRCARRHFVQRRRIWSRGGRLLGGHVLLRDCGELHQTVFTQRASAGHYHRQFVGGQLGYGHPGLAELANACPRLARMGRAWHCWLAVHRTGLCGVLSPHSPHRPSPHHDGHLFDSGICQPIWRGVFRRSSDPLDDGLRAGYCAGHRAGIGLDTAKTHALKTEFRNKKPKLSLRLFIWRLAHACSSSKIKHWTN